MTSGTTGDEQLVDVLRLARDLCIGIGAFCVWPEGRVAFALSPVATIRDVGNRIEMLARGCLSHPSARSKELFWNAELTDEGEAPEDSLACVAMPLWAGDEWVGLLGVVDTWLPELDDEQRSGLARLARLLARRLAGGGGAVPEGEGGPATPSSSVPTGAGAAAARSSAAEGRTGAFIEELADNLPDGLVVCREDGTIIYANGTLAAMSGLAPEEILGGDIAGLLTPDEDQFSVAETEPDFTEFLLGNPPPGRRLRLAATTGEELPVDVCGSRLHSSIVGDCFAALLRDARRPVVGLPPAAARDEMFGPVLDALDEGIVVCDSEGVVTVANRAARELQGLDQEEELVGHPFPASTALCTSDGSPLSLAHHPLTRALHGTVVRAEQLLLGSSEGSRRHIVASARPLEVRGGPGALLVLRDVTTQLQEEAWLTHLALHDPLTGLANRYLLLDYLRRMLGEFRSRGGAVALVFLDLDDFKQVNDLYGHDVGDEVLIAVSRRVQGSVRSGDIVARLGGDEFVVAHTAGDPGEIELVVSRIRKSLAAPYQVHGHSLMVSASIGWVVADPRHEDPMSLLVRADREMYRRKSARARNGESATGT
ncbi:MAG TPA: diguanylate cyclase [Acidimicrobiales bacterium]|nr:diguanylate cyclase [Acidimicrobiales bacterium]